MDVKSKRKELLKLEDRALVDRILAFPDRERLNRDDEGKRRRYPSAEMAVRARKQMEKDPDWKISDKQRYVMADSFAQYSSDELKVSGITFAKADPNKLAKEQVSKEGVKAVYAMQFHLVPEPENEHDRNAVAVYADNAEGDGRTRIGYVPAAYVQSHPIREPMDVSGTLTDHSNGKFKTISYTMDMDTEKLCREARHDAADRYTYAMPFHLNGDAKPGAVEYLTGKRDWAQLLNNELEYWGVNGKVDAVSFDIGVQNGCVNVECSEKLNSEAMQVCGSWLRYGLENGIGSDLKRDGYVDVPLQKAAVDTREKSYFSLQSEPDFSSAVESLKRPEGPAI